MNSKTRDFIKSFGTAGACLAMVVLFQNCAPTGFRTFKVQSSSVESPTQTSAPNSQKVAVFVAVGHQARTVMSCDDGQTWIHDQSDNDAARCYLSTDPNYVECDHSSTSNAGLDYNDGYFFAGYGHGAVGTARRSTDGFHWTTIYAGSPNGGIHFANNILLWITGFYEYSTDLGATWVDNRANMPGYILPRTTARAENTILMSADDTVKMVSNDVGKSWKIATLNGVQWQRNLFMAKGNGALVAVGAVANTAYTATSTDNGVTWNGTALMTAPLYSNWNGLFFDGNKFSGFFGGKMFTSTDGVNWNGTALNTAADITNSAIMRGPTGTYVAISDIYDRQKFYRSTDGINWTPLAINQFKGGHPILRMTAGYVDASACK